MTLIKPAAEKLPLAARKNVRDEWDNKKAELEGKMLALVGTAWKFETDPLSIWPYAVEGSYGHNSLGACIYAYFESFISTFSYFLQSHKEGAQEINTVCPKHIVTLAPSEKFSYSGCEVVDGKLCLLFHPNNLGSNINSVAQEIGVALSTAPQPEGAPSLSFIARHSIKADYDEPMVTVLEKARKALHNPKFEFDPGFDALGAMLKNGKDVRDDWEKNLGSFALQYFGSFVDQLEREKFGEDDLLREGFEEVVPKAVLKLRIVDKLSSGYNEILLDDGAIVIQTTPDKWGTNIHYAAEKLVSIL